MQPSEMEIERMTSSAEQLAASLGQRPAEDVTEVEETDELELEETEDPAEVEELEEEREQQPETDALEETEPEGEAELPTAVKEILRKNRAEVRAANKRAAQADRYKGLVVRQAMRDAFADAGLAEVPEAMFRLIELAKVDIDENSQLSGLEDQIEHIKQDFAALLKPKTIPAPRRRPADGPPRETAPVQKSSAEQLAERLLRR